MTTRGGGLTVDAYNTLQIKFICLYARRKGLNTEEAAKRWVAAGLARRFSRLYRMKYLGELQDKG